MPEIRPNFTITDTPKEFSVTIEGMKWNLAGYYQDHPIFFEWNGQRWAFFTHYWDHTLPNNLLMVPVLLS